MQCSCISRHLRHLPPSPAHSSSLALFLGCARKVGELWKEVKPLLDRNAEDDEKDDDGDGVSDVDQLTPPELLQRKAFLIVTTVKHPENIQSAIGSIYAALLAVPA